MPAASRNIYPLVMEIARLYLQSQESFVGLVADLSDDEWRTPVPCTPDWTIRDVLSHQAGVTADVLRGRVDGAGTDPWTAAQVIEWADMPADALIAQWNEQIGPVADAIEAFGEARPPIDCHTHEHDIRHALGLPGNRDSELVGFAMARMADGWTGRPIHVELVEGGTVRLGAGDDESLRLSGVTRFDVVRSRLGRRSRDQVVSWSWSEPLTPDETDEWFWFGPTTDDIVE